ncbi:MAG: terpene cyclase/mutase family protein [Bacteroidetes bacterium]|nr:terpene cyclase/mutase family protein [Bacteroidota bacterium]
MWEQQQEDGGWHSELHGLLLGGEAYTPFVLCALMQVSDSIYPKDPDKINSALDFIRTHTNDDGILGVTDPDVMEYPNYSTAYGLKALQLYGSNKDQELIRKMKDYLISEQFTEQRGINKSHPAYGSWGFGEKIMDGQTGHLDISHTRRILEALRVAGVDETDIYLKARSFLAMLQKHPSERRPQPGLDSNDSRRIHYDGGFYYSDLILEANKAKQEPGDSTNPPHYPSYATATCDGLLALLATGMDQDDEEVMSAMNWLEENNRLSHPEGIDEDDPDQWHLILQFYHIMVRSEVYAATGKSGGWKQDVIELLLSKQQENGSYSNPMGGMNKEDDPILATSFAIIALVNSL